MHVSRPSSQPTSIVTTIIALKFFISMGILSFRLPRVILLGSLVQCTFESIFVILLATIRLLCATGLAWATLSAQLTLWLLYTIIASAFTSRAVAIDRDTPSAWIFGIYLSELPDCTNEQTIAPHIVETSLRTMESAYQTRKCLQACQ